LYVGSHQTERGFFLKMHAPVGVISVNPQFYHTNNIASANYPVGALNQGASPTDTVAAPNTTLDDAFQNPKGNGFLKAMNKGLIGCKRTSSAKFGDFEASLGYNIVADEKKHLGLAVRFSAPTGNKAEAIYMLEPIFGRNGHWGAGGEIIGHWKFWESDTDDKYAQIVFDGDALHLFNSTTMRSFDLAGNGSGSKYLLLGKYAGTPGVFQNEIVNAVNVTTISTQSSFAIEGNFALAFDFHWNNFSFALGYEGWGRSCEKLKINCGCPGSINYNDYAVLGRQQPFLRTAAFTAINLCQPNATIGESLDYVAALPVGVSEIKDATLSASRLSETDALDVDGQRARSVYTNKPFAQIQYTWRDSDYNPYLAISGGAEIPSGKNQNSAARFWNIGVQGGLAF
ncbi:hypothetical protein KBD08_04005, partial [Candidatus Babeliales bacterium]|nr:hypothetical protein [Candidatus Babeliales bacterium]